MSMRSAASCCQPLQESVAPRDARMVPRLAGVSMVESGIAVILHRAIVRQVGMLAYWSREDDVVGLVTSLSLLMRAVTSQIPGWGFSGSHVRLRDLSGIRSIS